MTEEKQQKKVLFLLDAYALIYRSHFAFSQNPRVTSKGRNTGVMFGFTNSLLEIIQKYQPTHIGVAFDAPGPTFRHESFAEYKANRQEMPEDVREGIPIVKEIVEGFKIPVIECSGYEADDIIGTLVKKASAQGFTVYMMTPDKDFGQLVDDNVFLFKPAYMGNSVDILGVEEVKEKWGIERVDQVRDMLGLQGDSSDNIPGIPGIGPKTAQKFIKEFGSVENLVANAHKLKGKQRENLENFGSQGILSKELATINIETPVDFEPEKLEYKGPDESKLRPLFEDLEFRTIIQRIFPKDNLGLKTSQEKSQLDLFSTASAKTSPTADPDQEIETEKLDFYSKHHFQRVLDSPGSVERLVPYVLRQKRISLILHREGNSVDSTLKGLAISYFDEESFYIPFPDVPADQKAILETLRRVLENEDLIVIGHDLKPDFILLRKLGIDVKCKCYDIMLAHYLLDPETRHSLDVIAENYAEYRLIGPKQEVTANKRKQAAAVYGEQAEVLLSLYDFFQVRIKEMEVEDLLANVELPLMEVLADMEFEGVCLDKKVLSDLSKILDEDSKVASKRIFELAGEEFNINSPKQLGTVLFEKLNLIEKPKKTRSGQYATGEEILTKLADENEIVRKILDFREFQKLKSTYVDALPDLVSKFDGRLHTTFSQAVAATGRLSSNNPNLQNIPIRTEQGREIRKAFVPRDKEYVLVSADYSQIELRIMASFSEDKHMMDAFIKGQDIHTTTASQVFDVKPDEVDHVMRRKAKAINFGIIYGISAFGLAQNLNIPRKEAADIIEAYFNEFPAIKKYIDRVINEAREKMFVTTILGRKRYLNDITSRNATMRGYAERNAVNAPIQGSAADMIKVAMINIQNWMGSEKLKSKMVLQVHDELVFDAHHSEVEVLKKNVKKFMQKAIELKVPIEVGFGQGGNWLEAH